jgi:hypothetical protein
MLSIDNWAIVGLRTLLLAKRSISTAEYEEWNKEMDEVHLSKENEEVKN